MREWRCRVVSENKLCVLGEREQDKQNVIQCTISRLKNNVAKSLGIVQKMFTPLREQREMEKKREMPWEKIAQLYLANIPNYKNK